MCLRSTVALLLACAATMQAQVIVEGSPNKDQRARPGDRYAGVIVLRNNSNDPQEVRLYQRDYETTAEGRTLFPPAGTVARSNASWVTIGRSGVIVPAKKSLELAYTVSVPAMPLAGSYWSMLMVEVVPRSSPASSLGAAPGPPRIGVETRLRQAVTIVTNVDSGTTRDARFASPVVQVSKRDSSQALQVDLHNTGNRGYPPKLRLELYGPTGLNVTTLSTTREYLYPGSSMRETFPLGRLPHGRYRAILTVDCGAGAVFGAQYAFVF